MATLKIIALLLTLFAMVYSAPNPGFFSKHNEHHTIHVPYKIHTIHHHHVEKVPVIKHVVKHVPVYKEVHVPVYKEIHVPVPVHHEEEHHHKGWSSGWW